MTRVYLEDGIMIYNGDCRSILPALDPTDFDLILTDPPYGISHASNREDSAWKDTVIAGDDSLAARDFALNWAGAMPGFIFGTWKMPRPSSTRAVLIWDKGPASGMGDLSFPWKHSHEEIYVVGDGFQGHRDQSVISGFQVVTWTSKGRLHPNEKPLGLIRYLLSKTRARRVIDPFMGSGTTLRAAKDMGIEAVGIEIEPSYCAVAAERMAQLSLGIA